MNQWHLNLFLFHKLFASFSLWLFFTYGALLILKKTGSIHLVLLLAITSGILSIASLTIGLPFLLRLMNRLSVKASMIAGMVGIALTDIVFFTLPTSNYALFIWGLVLIALFKTIASNFYYIPANAIHFTFIGQSELPGKTSSLFSIISILSATAATGLGFTLGSEHFLQLFIFSGVAFLAGALTLRPIAFPSIRYTSRFPANLRIVSRQTHMAYWEFAHEMGTTAVPLVLVGLAGSFSQSIIIVGLGALGAILGVYLGGVLKDKGVRSLTLLASLGLLAGWVLYGLAPRAEWFIAAGILTGVASKILGAVRDSRFGKESLDGHTAFEAIFSIEISKASSRLVALLIMFAVFYATRSLPTILLLLSIPFLFPQIWYALGWDKKTARSASLGSQ